MSHHKSSWMEVARVHNVPWTVHFRKYFVYPTRWICFSYVRKLLKKVGRGLKGIFATFIFLIWLNFLDIFDVLFVARCNVTNVSLVFIAICSNITVAGLGKKFSSGDKFCWWFISGPCGGGGVIFNAQILVMDGRVIWVSSSHVEI